MSDIFSSRLRWHALICVILAFAATIGAAWAAFTYLLPLIPEGAGALRWVFEAAQLLGGAAILVIAVLLAPAISMFLGGLLFDVAAERVESKVFPGQPKGRMVPLYEGIWNGLRIAIPALLLNLISLPLFFVPGIGFAWFLALNGYLMGREYSSLAALRAMNWRDARTLRKRAPFAVFIVGLICSIVPFVAPLLGAAAMTRLVKALSPQPA
ncbi:MAG: EI24 domain-containing protein [Caulobacterales bacterium]